MCTYAVALSSRCRGSAEVIVQMIGDLFRCIAGVHCWWYRYRGGARQVQSTCRGSDEATDVQVQRCRGAVVCSSTVVQRWRYARGAEVRRR